MQGLSIVLIILVLVTSASSFLWFADKYIWLPSWYFHLAASKTCQARSLLQSVLSPYSLPPKPGPSPVFLSEPPNHPSGCTGQKWWQSENLSPLDISHPNYLWNICTLLCLPHHHPELPSPLTWKGGNSQLIRLPASPPPPSTSFSTLQHEWSVQNAK